MINDSFFIDNDITSYELLAACDSMITDYSSVYFDYTLCDKPIGLGGKITVIMKKIPVLR